MRRRLPRYRRHRGFSLIEVMISLVVIGIGLLGIAKMQALAVAATANASRRGLAAIASEGLASAMRANRAYWANVLAPATFTITNGVVSDPTLSTVVNCTKNNGAPCTPTQLAAYDMQQWGQQVRALLPNPVKTTFTCTALLAATPVVCTIQTVWSEQSMSVNNQGKNGTAAMTVTQQNQFGPVYTLTVEP